MRGYRYSLAGVVFMSLALAGCITAPQYEAPARVKWADEAGSVTVSPISVTRWEDVAASLQPKFKMDSDVALAASIPMTQTLDQRFSDILAASLQAALPTATASRSVTTTTDPETGETTTSIDATRTRRSGDPANAPAAAAVPATTAAALAALAADKPGRDPMLRYLAATALLQEVTLLNRYVTDKIQAPGDQAFLVRLQLAVLPNRRGMPYDVLTDVTLHADDVQAHAGLAPKGTAASGCKGSYDSLSIVPMVVTDNLEGLQASRSSDVARQIGIALLGTVQGIGASGSFGRTTNLLRATQGNETNSLLTIAKLADDTVRVRLGAVQSPTYQYATLPRTHNISLLVIYRPCKDAAGKFETAQQRTITAITRTTFRDAMSGAALPYEDASNRLYRQMGELRAKYPGRFSYLEFARLYQWANQQDRKRFFDYIDRKALRTQGCGGGIGDTLIGVKRYPDDPKLLDMPDDSNLVDLTENLDGDAVNETVDPPLSAECRELSLARYRMIAAALWTDLLSVRPVGEFAYTRIPLALRTTNRTLPVDQTALVTYSQAETSVTLSQAQDLIGLQRLRATLLDGTNNRSIAATETTIAADGASVSAKFPPLKRFGDVAKSGYSVELSVEDYGTDDPCNRNPPPAPATACRKTYSAVVFDGAPTTTSPYSVSATASGIVADGNGKGRLNVSIAQKGTDPISPKLFLRIEGAELSKIDVLRGASVEVKSDGWRITGSGELTLWMENLIPNQVVTISLEDNGTAVPNAVKKTVLSAAPVKRD